jgi:hypothetical protein
MHRSRARLLIAAGFFIFWLAVLVAGADFPPPPGFLLVVFFDLLAAAGVYHRIPAYADWAATRRPHRILRVLAEGAAAGLFLGLLTLLSPFGGEPSAPPPGWIEHFVWLTVLAGVGVVNALGVYHLVRLRWRRL